MSYLHALRVHVGTRPLLIPGGRAVVLDDDQVLLHRRSDLDVWDLPGGGAEVGESQEQAVLRELTEETGLVATDWTAFGLGSDPRRETVVYPNGDVVQGFALALEVRAWVGQLAHSDESTALRFFPLDELPELPDAIGATMDAHRRWRATAMFQLF